MKNAEKIKEIEVNLLREKAAARVLNVSVDTLRKSIRYKGLIPFIKFEKTIRYRRSDLDEFIEKHRVKAVI